MHTYESMCVYILWARYENTLHGDQYSRAPTLHVYIRIASYNELGHINMQPMWYHTLYSKITQWNIFHPHNYVRSQTQCQCVVTMYTVQHNSYISCPLSGTNAACNIISHITYTSVGHTIIIAHVTKGHFIAMRWSRPNTHNWWYTHWMTKLQTIIIIILMFFLCLGKC